MLHYYIELLAYILLAYFLGCLLGAGYRRMAGKEQFMSPEYAGYAQPVAPANPISAPPPMMAKPANEQPTASAASSIALAIANSKTRMVRPSGLTSARAGKSDELLRLIGVGPKNLKILNQLGIYHFDQVANWTSEQVAWVEDHMKFDGRIAREEWIRQARLLADGNVTEFERVYGKGRSAGASKGAKPKGISSARGGKADKLQRLSGVGPKNEKILHSLGFFHFDQIAEWSAEQIDWVDEHLNFNGRIKREEWVRQASLLAEGKEEQFKKDYGSGGMRSSKGEPQSGSRTRRS